MQAAAYRLSDVTEGRGALAEVVIVGTGRILGHVICVCTYIGR